MLSAAVIGCGHGGGLSLDALQKSDRYELVAAVDSSETALQDIAARFPGIRPFTDYNDMLAECGPDVVCVATPAPSHAPIGLDALRSGLKGLLLEKPLSSNVATAEALLNEVKSAGCPLVVPHGMLVLPAPREVKSRIKRGDIGDVSSIKIQNAVDLLNGGIHWIVYLLDVFEGDDPVAVAAEFDAGEHIVSDGVKVESRGRTRVTLNSGFSFELCSGKGTEPKSSVLPPEDQRGALFRIDGSEGAIEFSAWAGSYWIGTGTCGGKIVRCTRPDMPSYHQVFLEQLAQNIAERRPQYGSADLSLAALGLIETAYRQHDDRGWVLGAVAQEQKAGGPA